MARSRLTKRQQQKMVRQTIWITLTSVALLAAFIFFIIPQLIRFAGNVLDSGSLIETEDQVPPQVPVLSAPPTATNSATLPISGAGEAEAEAVLVVNGQEIERVTINGEGEFELEAPLTEGENSLVVYSVDQAENDSIQTKKYKITLDTTAPTIELEQPQDGDSFELRKNQLLEIKGQTEPQTKVYINNRLVYADGEGYFSTKHQLSEGENKLKFRVVDRGGNIAEKEITVSFRY